MSMMAAIRLPRGTPRSCSNRSQAAPVPRCPAVILLVGALALPPGCSDPNYAPARARRDVGIHYAVEALQNVENDFGRNMALLKETDRRLAGERKRSAEDMNTIVTGIEARRAQRFRTRQFVPSDVSRTLFFRGMSIPPEDFARLVY